MSDELTHAHDTKLTIATEEITPPHPPRTETAEYLKAHNFLIHQKKQGCLICGVNVDTLSDPAINTVGATQVESHHYPIERSLTSAVDPVKLHRDFPQVYDEASLMQFVDSPANLLVLCDSHHRSIERGIHHLVVQDWAVMKYLRDGYEVVATKESAAAAEAQDDAIEQAAGLEQKQEAA